MKKNLKESLSLWRKSDEEIYDLFLKAGYSLALERNLENSYLFIISYMILQKTGTFPINKFIFWHTPWDLVKDSIAEIGKTLTPLKPEEELLDAPYTETYDSLRSKVRFEKGWTREGTVKLRELGVEELLRRGSTLDFKDVVDSIVYATQRSEQAGLSG